MFVMATTLYDSQFFSVDILSSVSVAYLTFILYDTIFNNLIQMAACVYTQWSLEILCNENIFYQRNVVT